MSRLLLGINGKVNNFLAKGLRDAKNEFYRDSRGEKINIKYLIKGLDGATKKTVRDEMEMVTHLGIAERTLEYSDKFYAQEKKVFQDKIDKLNENLEITEADIEKIEELYGEMQKVRRRVVGLTGVGAGIRTDTGVAREFLAEFDKLKESDPKKHDRIIDGLRRYREFADAGLKYAVEKGRLSEKQYMEIKKTNKHYISLARKEEVKPDEELFSFLGESGNKLGSVKKIIHRAKGSSNKIQNPYLSLIDNTVKIVRESDRNETMQTFVKPLTKKRDMGDGKAINLAAIGAEVPSGKLTIDVYVKGKKQTWQFDEGVYHALKSMETSGNNVLQKVFKAPADLLRFTITNHPVFAARNFTRDTFARLILSRTGSSLSDLYSANEISDLFEVYGGSQAGFYLTNEEAYKHELALAVHEVTHKGGMIINPRKMSPRRFGRGYRKILQQGENLNRKAEYISSFKYAKEKLKYDDYNAHLYAAFQARDLMDFAVAGHILRELNKYVPFSNATVQAFKRAAKGVKEDKWAFAARTALYTLPMQLLMFSMAYFGDYEDDYNELSPTRRDLGWNFRLPMTGDYWYFIPKPFELGVPSAIFDRAISNYRGYDDAFEGVGDTSFKTLFPFDESTLMGGFKPWIEVSMNHDIWRDRNIVPYWEQDLDLVSRKGTVDASRIGKLVGKAFGADPRYIDHIIKGHTSYMGDNALSIGDIGVKNSRHGFRLSQTGFIKNDPVGQSKSVRKIDDIAKRGGFNNDVQVVRLRGMRRAYYLLEGEKEKKSLLKRIRSYAKGIRRDLQRKLNRKQAIDKANKKRAAR